MVNYTGITDNPASVRHMFLKGMLRCMKQQLITFFDMNQNIIEEAMLSKSKSYFIFTYKGRTSEIIQCVVKPQRNSYLDKLIALIIKFHFGTDEY